MLFDLCLNDMDSVLPQMQRRLLSTTENAQMTIERIESFLRNATESERDIIVKKLVEFNVIPTVCNVMQMSDDNFVKVVLKCLELACAHKSFYEKHVAINAMESVMRYVYCANKSPTPSTLFEPFVLSICNVLVRSSELDVDLDDVCVPQQIVRLVKDLDVRDSQQDKLKFAAVTMLNVVLQRAVLDEENVNEEMIIDVCCDALSSMTEIVKYGEGSIAISHATMMLCGTCAGSSRFCCADFVRDSQVCDELQIRRKKSELLVSIYDTTMTIIIPYVKDADLSCIDPVEFHRNLVSCLNNLYQLEGCNHDNLSNHLAANGYLKYFLRLTVQLPEISRRNICILLARILNNLDKMILSKCEIEFTNVLRQGLLELPKDSEEQWNSAIASREKSGTALVILLYYHFHGTQENDIASLQSLIGRVMLLSSSKATILILKPLWFLFAVTSISHPCPSSVHNYDRAIAKLTKVLDNSRINEVYTHHVDLLHHCIMCPDFSQNVVNQVLDLWLIESDGDIKPLLSFDCDKMFRRLLVLMQIGCPQPMMILVTKALRHLIKIGDRYIKQIANIVWDMLPNVISSHKSDTVTHIEAVLELANITQPQTKPTYLINRSVDSIVNIILKKTTNLKFMTLLIKQAYIFLVATVSRKSFKVLGTYIKNVALLNDLYAYGFSKRRSELSSISIKLLAFIVHCQKKSSIKCKQPLIVRVKCLVELLTHTAKSPYCATNGMQFIRELLTQNADGSAVALQEIADAKGADMVINLYEFLHCAHAQKDPVQRDLVYQCLTALLDFCSAKVPALVPHLCTVMSNYDLVLNVASTRHVSCDFVTFAAAWLRYRKTTCNDVPWSSESLYKSPFDEALDHLREYSVIVNNKDLKDACLELQHALSQYSSEQ